MLSAPAPALPPRGVQRAAVLVVALGVEAASAFLPTLTDDEVEAVSVEVARLQRVPGETVAAVLEAYRAATTQALPLAGADGGLDAARELVRSLDEARAGAVLPRVEAATEGTGFDLAAAVPAADLAAFLAPEHPQTAAVVLSRLGARAAADTLAHLPAPTRGDVIRRLSTLAPPPDAALRELDAALRTRFGRGPVRGPDGVKRAADILTQAGTEAGREVLTALQAREPELAGRIESLLFVFEDLERIDARELGQVLARAEQSALAVALHGAEASLSARVFENVSERVGAALREEMELNANPSASDVAEARLAVIGAALALAEEGAVTLDPVDAAELAPA